MRSNLFHVLVDNIHKLRLKPAYFDFEYSDFDFLCSKP